MESKNPPPYLPSLGRALGFATTATGKVAQSLLDPHNLSLKHWTIMTALWREDGLLISQIAKYRGVNLPAASRIMDRMEEKGLVYRRDDPNDRRATRIHLTDAAKQLGHLIGIYQDVNDILLEGFTQAEAKTLFDLLERISVNAKKYGEREA